MSCHLHSHPLGDANSHQIPNSSSSKIVEYFSGDPRLPARVSPSLPVVTDLPAVPVKHPGAHNPKVAGSNLHFAQMKAARPRNHGNFLLINILTRVPVALKSLKTVHCAQNCALN